MNIPTRNEYTHTRTQRNQRVCENVAVNSKIDARKESERQGKNPNTHTHTPIKNTTSPQINILVKRAAQKETYGGTVDETAKEKYTKNYNIFDVL